MIIDRYELDLQLEKLRQNTFSVLWKERFENSENADPLIRLKDALTEIGKSKDRELQKKAITIIQSIVSIDVDCDPTVDISF